MRYRTLSNEEFVRAWKRAKSQADMQAITGLSKNHIYVRARFLRSRGVLLPSFTDRRFAREWDIEKLNKIWDDERVARR